MKKPNLFTSAWLAIINGNTAEIRQTQQRVNRYLHYDPTMPDAIVAWTLLELLHGRADKANERVSPLVKEFPDNPFYLMASTEIVFQKESLSNDEAINLLRTIEQLAEGWDEADVCGKIGCMAALRGFWSYAIPLFVRAMQVQEQKKPAAEEDLILLWKRNEASLNKLVQCLPTMDLKGLKPYDFDSVPLDTVARAFCILFTADLAGIHEAWPACIRIASYHHDLQQAWNTKQIPNFLATHCPDWMIYQPAGSPVRTTPFNLN